MDPVAARDIAVRIALSVGFLLLILIAVKPRSDDSKYVLDIAFRCLRFGAAKALMDVGPLLL